jgi:hypothetical protein
MIKASRYGSGSIPLTTGSGFWRSNELLIRIRIRNTTLEDKTMQKKHGKRAHLKIYETKEKENKK